MPEPVANPANLLRRATRATHRFNEVSAKAGKTEKVIDRIYGIANEMLDYLSVHNHPELIPAVVAIGHKILEEQGPTREALGLAREILSRYNEYQEVPAEGQGALNLVKAIGAARQKLFEQGKGEAKGVINCCASIISHTDNDSRDHHEAVMVLAGLTGHRCINAEGHRLIAHALVRHTRKGTPENNFGRAYVANQTTAPTVLDPKVVEAAYKKRVAPSQKLEKQVAAFVARLA